MQAFEIVGRHRFFEPAHSQLRKGFCLRQSLLAIVGAVGVYEELDVIADCLAGGAHPIEIILGTCSDLHLHPTDSLSCPAAELLLKSAK